MTQGQTHTFPLTCLKCPTTGGKKILLFFFKKKQCKYSILVAIQHHWFSFNTVYKDNRNKYKSRLLTGSHCYSKSFSVEPSFHRLPSVPILYERHIYIYSPKSALIPICHYFEARLLCIHFSPSLSLSYLPFTISSSPAFLPTMQCGTDMTFDNQSSHFPFFTFPSCASSFDLQKHCECSTCLIKDNKVTLSVSGTVQEKPNCSHYLNINCTLFTFPHSASQSLSGW